MRKTAWLLVLALTGCAADEGAHDPADTAVDAAVEDTAADAGAVDAGADSGDAGEDAAPDSADTAPDAGPPFDHCDDLDRAACFAARRDPGSEQVALALAIAQAQMDAHPAASLGWDWGEAVLMWSFLQLHAVTGEPALLDYARAFMDHHVDEGFSIQTSDSCSPAAIAALLGPLTGDDRYQPVVDDALDYLANRALRTDGGAISHMGIIPVVTVWADSLFMFGNVWLARWQAADDAASRDALAEQLRLFAEVLQDPGGLYRHAAFWVVEPEEPVYWARGNGWAAAAAAQAVYEHALGGAPLAAAELSPVVQALRSQVAAVAAAQDAPTGLWWNFVDHPDAMYRETSATALFAYAMARAWRAGHLDDEALPVVARALAGVKGRIVERDGRPVVTGTSGPTTADLAETYAKVPLVDDISYGVGAAILALVETSGLPLPDATVTLDPIPWEPPPPDEVWEQVPWEPSDAFLGRRATYLQACHDASGPGSGAIYGQVCRVAKGGDVDEATIQAALDKVAARQDTADFRMAALVRLLLLDDETHALPVPVRAAIEQGVLGFRYWLDQPGDDKMCFWSENHQILFHSAELLAGERFPDAVFPNAGMTGAEHAAHARPRVLRWLDRRLRLGFSEWHSNVYFNEDIPALANLADFAADPEIRERAAMVLDVLALDLLGNTFDGLFATVHGRTYESHLVDGYHDSTQEAAWLMLGLGEMGSPTNFSAAFLATGTWAPPPILEAVAADAAGPVFEHRQRDGIDVADGPAHGIGYTEPDDVVFWAGMAALAASQVVDGTVLLLDTYGLWDGFLFGDLPDSVDSLLASLKGSPGALAAMAADLDAITRGIALESMSTYTFRTAEWQLSGGQDYNPGLWGAQTLMWQATIDADAYVFTSAPANLGDLLGSATVELATGWVGGFLPRVTLHRGVGVIQYRPASVPGLDDDLSAGYLHAYFPRAAFDEVREEGAWIFGRKGAAYVALGSELPMKQGAEDWELVVEGTVNAFVVELSSEAEAGSFDAFVASVAGAAFTAGDAVSYASPSVGLVEVGWEGPLLVDGEPVDLGPYARWDNPFVVADFAAPVTTVTRGDDRLVLDGDAGTRTTWKRAE